MMQVGAAGIRDPWASARSGTAGPMLLWGFWLVSRGAHTEPAVVTQSVVRAQPIPLAPSLFRGGTMGSGSDARPWGSVHRTQAFGVGGTWIRIPSFSTSRKTSVHVRPPQRNQPGLGRVCGRTCPFSRFAFHPVCILMGLDSTP